MSALLVSLLFGYLQLTIATWDLSDDEFFHFPSNVEPCHDFERYVCQNNSGVFNLISVEFQKLAARLAEGPPAYFYSAVMPKFLDEAVWINTTNNMHSVGCPPTDGSFQIARNIWSQMNAVLIAYNLFKKTNPSDDEKMRFFVGYMASRCENNFRLDGFYDVFNFLKSINNQVVVGFKDFTDVFHCQPTDRLYRTVDRISQHKLELKPCMTS